MGHGRDIERRLSDTKRGHYGTIWGMDGMVSGTTCGATGTKMDSEAVEMVCMTQRLPEVLDFYLQYHSI